MTISPARMITPAITDLSILQFSLTLRDRRFSIAAEIFASCCSLSAAAEMTSTSAVASLYGTKVNKLLQNIRERVKTTIFSHYPNQVLTVFVQLLTTNCDKRLGERFGASAPERSSADLFVLVTSAANASMSCQRSTILRSTAKSKLLWRRGELP